jgi:hypothetical protein
MAKIDPFKARISEHLQEVAQTDKLFAVTLQKPNKSIDGCISYIYSEVKKTGRCGFNDDEIFQMAIHYYDEDSIKDTPVQHNVKVSHTEEKSKRTVTHTKQNITTPEAITSKPKPTITQQIVIVHKHGQTSLF